MKLHHICLYSIFSFVILYVNVRVHGFKCMCMTGTCEEYVRNMLCIFCFFYILFLFIFFSLLL